MPKKYNLTAEEEELVHALREERKREARSKGGKVRGEQIKEAWLTAEREPDPRWAQAKELMGAGKNTSEVAKELGVSRSTAWRWMNTDPALGSGQKKGGESLARATASAEARIKGMEAITAELKRRTEPQVLDPQDSYGMIQGELRDDTIIELTSSKIGIISDVHVPFHDLRMTNGELHGAYLTALEYLRDAGIETLVINGDFMDCYNISKHEKLEDRRSFSWELSVTRRMLESLREYFGDKVRIIYREGNHEERWVKFVAGKVPEVKDLMPSLEDLLNLRQLNIEWVSERGKISAGQLWIDHGHEWFGSGGVTPARAYRMKAGDNILVGHVHRTSFDMFKRPLDGSFFAGWSMGCLCDMNPLYAPRNSWNHGVVLVELDKTGDFTVNNRIIIGGKVR